MKKLSGRVAGRLRKVNGGFILLTDRDYCKGGIMRFYCEEIRSGVVELGGVEAHHLGHVRRLGVGDEVELFDGEGRAAKATIREVGRKAVRLEVGEGAVEVYERRTSGRVVIAVSVAKGQRFDWLVGKAAELGADHIAAVLFERTVKQASGAAASERYHKLTVAAAKQCGRVFLPRLTGPATLGETIEAMKGDYPGADMFYGAAGGADGGRGGGAATAGELAAANGDAVVFVGPEGGITAGEEDMLGAAGIRPARLTETVLRIETAGVGFAAILCAGRDSRG